ncbi:MAG: SRPBCC family protein [Nocardioides sp.]
MDRNEKISTSIIIDVPAEQVWEVIGPGFARVGEWVSAIGASRGVAVPGPNGAPVAGRACQVAAAGFGQIAEELTSYDPQARRLSYRVSDGMPSFVTGAQNTWQARPYDERRTQFTMDAEFTLTRTGRLAAPFLRAYLSRVGRRTSADLKALLETGTPSRAKAIQIHTTGRTALDRFVMVNALFSAASGVTLATANQWWSYQLGNPGAGLIASIGASLVGYGVLLAWTAGGGVTSENGRTFASLDAAWVLATLAVLGVAGSTFTSTGLAATLLTGLLVAVLGALQWRAANRLKGGLLPPSALSHSAQGVMPTPSTS